jgi:FkbM family methyltransferase
MKVFLDLGLCAGDMLEKFRKSNPDFDMYVGFEPIPPLYKKTKKRFENAKRVHVKNYAIDTKNTDGVKIYVNNALDLKGKKCIGHGSSLMETKTSGHLDKNKYFLVETIDFSEYLSVHFKKDDYIVVKMDIEGKEYDVLEHLIETGNISFINKLYCEWHYHKLSDEGIKERHNSLVSKLIELDFDITGKNKHDEYSKVIK